MAPAAHSLANAAIVQHSTGPRTEAGEARSARNSTTHGFTTGVLVSKPQHPPIYDSLKQGLIAESRLCGAVYCHRYSMRSDTPNIYFSASAKDRTAGIALKGSKEGTRRSETHVDYRGPRSSFPSPYDRKKR